MINGGLLLNTLPLTFIGVMLSLNVFSVSFLAALVPPLGACLFGLSLMKLWMELAVRRLTVHTESVLSVAGYITGVDAVSSRVMVQQLRTFGSPC